MRGIEDPVPQPLYTKNRAPGGGGVTSHMTQATHPCTLPPPKKKGSKWYVFRHMASSQFFLKIGVVFFSIFHRTLGVPRNKIARNIYYSKRHFILSTSLQLLHIW